MGLDTICGSEVYADLPSYTRGADWYHARGSEVKVVIPHSVMENLLSDAYKLGSENEVGFVLLGYQPENLLRMLVTDYEPITRGNATSISSKGPSYLNAALRAKNRSTQVEQSLGLPTDKKVIVGGAHTHPGHGVFLSKEDQQSIQEFINYAKKHPQLYALTDGNFELVMDPKAKQVDGFKLYPKGYETVNVYVKNLEDCIPELTS